MYKINKNLYQTLDINSETSKYTGQVRFSSPCGSWSRLYSIVCYCVSMFICQCAYGGCLMELCIQLSITMLGKQLIQNNLFEIGIP